MNDLLSELKSYYFQSSPDLEEKISRKNKFSGELEYEKKEYSQQKIIDLFYRDELSDNLIKFVLSLFRSDDFPDVQNRLEFGEAYLSYISQEISDASLVHKILTTLGYQLIRNGFSYVSLADVCENVSEEYGLDKEEVARVIDNLIDKKILFTKRSGENVRLFIPIILFQKYLAGLYLAEHKDILIELIDNDAGVDFIWHESIYFTIEIIKKGAYETSQSISVDEIITQLLNHKFKLNTYLLGEVLASGFEFQPQETEKIISDLFDIILEKSSYANDIDEAFKLLIRLARRYNQRDDRFYDRIYNHLISLAEDENLESPYIRLGAAEAACKVNPHSEMKQLLISVANGDKEIGNDKFDFDKEIGNYELIRKILKMPNQLLAIEFLSNIGANDQAKDAAWEIVKSKSEQSLRAAEKSIKLGDHRVIDLLVNLANDRNQSDSLRNRAAIILNRNLKKMVSILSNEERIINIYWQLFESDLEPNTRQWAFSKLMSIDIHLRNRDRVKNSLNVIVNNSSEREEMRWWSIEQLEELGYKEDLGELCLNLGNDESVDSKIRLKALTKAVDYLLPPKEALQALANLVKREDKDITPETRIDAAKALQHENDLTMEGLDSVPDVMKKLAWDEKISPANRAAAAAAWGLFNSPSDAASELLKLGLQPDPELRLYCGKQLGEMGKLTHARNLLVRIIKDKNAPFDIGKEAVWQLGRFKQFDELLVAFETGELSSNLWDETSMVFQEYRANPIVRRMREEGINFEE